MGLADKITASRIALTPLFVLLYFLPALAGASFNAFSMAALLAVYVLVELSDAVDGAVARRRGEVSDFGKLFDPFADTFARLSYFLCFAFDGRMPFWALFPIVWREFGILFLRLLMAQRGVAMGARPGGKLKAVVYMLAGIVSLASLAMSRFSIDPALGSWIGPAIIAIYGIATALSIASFIDYFAYYRRTAKGDAR